MPRPLERLPQKVVEEEIKEMIPGVETLNLSLKEMRFLASYISTDFNAQEAYINCTTSKKMDAPSVGGITAKSAAAKGSAMLRKKKVMEGLALYMKAFIGEHKDKLEYKILNQLYLRAFYNPFDVIREDGELKPMNEIPFDHRQLIVGIKRTMHPKDPSATVTEVKLADRDKARKELELYINMLHVDTKTSHSVEKSVKDQLSDILGKVKNSGFKPPPRKKPTEEEVDG